MNLLIGIQGKKPHSQILKEMLNHQGVIFEEVVDGTDYPCIIYTGIEGEDVKTNNVINAEKIIPMDRIEIMLSGTLNQNLNHPDVNKYEIKIVEEIRKVLYSQELPLIKKWFWPNFAKACCIMTHDIDRLSIPPIYARRETPNLIKFLLYVLYYYEKYILRVKKFNDYIDLIIDIETKYGVKSSFYFFPEYEEHEEFVNILKILKEKKSEVGLHSESENYEQLKKEKKQLEEYYCGEIYGTRQHLLKFSAPQTWQYQEKLLEYDLTFYRNEEFGYRSGLCFPYKPISTKSIIEIPTLFMDWTALNKKMNYKQIKEELYKIINIVENYNGCLVLNFHNEYFNKIAFPHIHKSFTYVIKYIQNDYWITTAHECVSWWKKRESTKINIEFKDGRIVGTCSNEIPIIIEYKNKTIKYLNAKEAFSVEC
jgi:hypothetical protein